MSVEFLPNGNATAEPHLRAICAELEERLRQGEVCQAEEFFAKLPELAAQTEPAIDLIYIEYLTRLELGQQALARDFYTRFPQWQDYLRQQFEFHEMLRASLPEGAAGAAAPVSHSETGPRVPAQGKDGPLQEYEFLSEIARGGMGVLYKARQISLNRIVALKMILAGSFAGVHERSRFRVEAEAAARLQHPNIVQIYEVGELSGQPFLALEYVEGCNLDQLLAKGPQPARAAAELLETLAQAMHVAHRQGIIHRDLKPANILLGLRMGSAPAPPGSTALIGSGPLADGRESLADYVPKITDFGLAKHLEAVANATGHYTQSGAIVGTPAYMAPEQAFGESKHVGPPADIYALGVILYESLTGRPPFQAATVLETLNQVRYQEPVTPRRLQPTLPRDLETICLKCLQKNPGKRYPTAEALADDLRRFLNGEPIVARPVGALERAAKWARRRPAVAALTAVIFVAALTLLAGWGWFTAELRAERNYAQKGWGAAEKNLLALEQQSKLAEAQRQRAEGNFRLARETVDRYCTQVGSNRLLNEPGMHPLRKELLEAAVPFYRDLVKQQDRDPEVRLELARAYRGLAHITFLTGSNEEGLKQLQEGLVICRQLIDAHPDNLTYPRELAIGEKVLGERLRRLGQRGPSEAAFHRALEIQERLAQREPPAPSDRLDLARTYIAQGLLYMEGREPEQARRGLEKALEFTQQLVRQRPQSGDCWQTLAQAHNRYAAFLLDQGDIPRTKEHYEETLRIYLDLASKYPKHFDYKDGVAQTWVNLGVVYYRHLRDPEQAEAAFQKALALRQELAHDYGELTHFQVELAKAHNNLGQFYNERKQKTQAEDALLQALTLRQQISRRHPLITQYQVELAQTHSNLGTLYQETNRPTQAEAAYTQAIRILERLHADQPDVLSFPISLGAVYGNVGNCLSESGRPQEAIPWYQKAVDLLEDLHKRQPRQLEVRLFLRNAHWGFARSLVKSNRWAEARNELDRVLTLDDGRTRAMIRLERARVLARLGDLTAALAEADALFTSQARDDSLYMYAEIYARAAAAPGGEQHARRALDCLTKLQAEGYFADAAHYDDWKTNPGFQSLLNQPEYQKLLTAPKPVSPPK